VQQSESMEVEYSKVAFSTGLNCKIYSKNVRTTFEANDIYAVLIGDVYIDGKLSNISDITEYYRLSTYSLSTIYSKCSGQFSLIIVNKQNDEINIVNDQLGVQPCYYTLQNDCLYISDSLKTLKNNADVSLNISKQAIFNYMYFHCIPSPNTIYNEVNKLEPGKAITLDKQLMFSEQVMYSPEFSSSTKDKQQLQKTCLSTIEEVVAHQVTDDCGAFLSGGLDSSTVAGMLAKSKNPAKTFSIGFHIDGYDETEYAKLTAKHFGTQHEVLYLEPDQAAAEFVKVAQYFDEPFGNSSSMAAYFCALFAKKHGVSTLLAGDGGDELFAGNERYAKQKVFERYYQLPKFARSLLKLGLDNEFASSLPGISKASSYVKQAEVQLPERLHTYNFINQVGLKEMFTSDFLNDVDIEQPVKQLNSRYHEAKSTDATNKMLYLDWKFTLADNDLIKVNKMCELAGVKVKYPLLDKRVVDFSCDVPAEVKLPGQKLRDFYKNTCRGFLADETLDKEKHGFGLPFGLWLKENEALKGIATEALASFKKRNIVKNSLIDKALEAHANVHAKYFGELIWIMVVLELWLQQED